MQLRLVPDLPTHHSLGRLHRRGEFLELTRERVA